MRILVTGATGYVRRRTPVTLDAAQPAATSAGLAEAGPTDVVYHLVHGIGQPGYRGADSAAAATVAEAAKAAGVPDILVDRTPKGRPA